MANEKASDDQIEKMGERYSIFTQAEKWCIIAMVSYAAWFSTLTSFIYYPAIHQLSQTFSVSVDKINLTITIYMAVATVAPTLVGDAADVLGRRPVYVIVLSLYMAANLAIALAKSYEALLGLRLLQALAISGKLYILYTISTADVPRHFLGGVRGYYRRCVSCRERFLRECGLFRVGHGTNFGGPKTYRTNKHNHCTQYWSHTRRRSELCRRLGLDLLVFIHGSRLVPFNNAFPPTRDFPEYSRQWIDQTRKAFTDSFSDDHVSLAGERGRWQTQVANPQSAEILDHSSP